MAVVTGGASGFGGATAEIAPGIFETPMMAGAPDRVRDPLIDIVPFPKRLGQAAEFALLARGQKTSEGAASAVCARQNLQKVEVPD